MFSGKKSPGRQIIVSQCLLESKTRSSNKNPFFMVSDEFLNDISSKIDVLV